MAMRWSGGTLRRSTPSIRAARENSSAWLISGARRKVVPRFADSDGLILLVLSRACHLGSGGAGGATALAGAFAWATTPAPAPTVSPAGASAQGGLPSTSTVSYLMTSTGHPSAAVMIEGVSGLR